MVWRIHFEHPGEMVREGGHGKKTLVSFRPEKLVGVCRSGPDRPEFVGKSPS
jgi:hypothetical protein